MNFEPRFYKETNINMEITLKPLFVDYNMFLNWM